MKYPQNILLVLVLPLLVLTAGCNAVNYSKAQGAFSRGTELKNIEEAGLNFGASGVSLAKLYDFSKMDIPEGNAKQQFEYAKTQLNKALKKKASLRKDGLLANAYVLLALTEYQLQNYDAAKEQAAAARTIFNEDASSGREDGGRDLALSYAIDPMITITQLYDSIKILNELPVVMDADSNKTTTLVADFYRRRISEENNGSLESALKAVDFAIGKTINTKETTQYLRNYEMAGLLNNRSLLDKFLVAGQQSGTFRRKGQALQDQFRNAESHLDELVETYRKKLLEASPKGEQDVFYRFWKGRVF